MSTTELLIMYGLAFVGAYFVGVCLGLLIFPVIRRVQHWVRN